MKELRAFESRLESVENALAAAAAGIFDEKVPLDLTVEPDALSSIEQGMNLMLDDVAALRRRDAERSRELEDTLARAQEQTRSLEQALHTIQVQQQAIAELSTPILQVWEDVLAMPIIGVVDTKRSLDIMERLLREVALRQSRYVILDITGVEVVDTKTADHFIKVVQAARLLGTSCVISGVRPAVAQTLVEIGVDMAGVVTVATLKDALRECLRRMGRLRAAAPRVGVDEVG